MVRTGLVALIFAAGIGAAAAQSNTALALTGPVGQATTWKRSCAEVQGIVEKYGKAVLTHSPRGFDDSSLLTALATFGRHTSDRVVKDQRYCLHREATSPIYVSTRDNVQCFAGYTCGDGGNGWGGKRGW